MSKARDFISRFPYSSITLAALIGASLLFFAYNAGLVTGASNDSECLADYEYINPEPDCEKFEARAAQIEKLQTLLEEKVSSYKDNRKIQNISVFTRDLTTRRYAGVDENKTFIMASLLKLPLAVAHYKYAEVEPDYLNKALIYSGSPDLYNLQKIEPPEKLKIGEPYTIRELIRRALSYSDNTAAQILFENLPSRFLDDILKALSIKFEKTEGETENLVTAKSYANVFRVLYNSSYLTREYSDEILRVLSGSTNEIGASAVLPRTVKVVHKFGERSLFESNSEKLIFYQLHDCGIVYANYGKDPYTFCIMTQGEDFELLKKIIEDISLVIYEELESDRTSLFWPR